jgi:hypothetical protein
MKLPEFLRDESKLEEKTHFKAENLEGTKMNYLLIDIQSK